MLSGTCSDVDYRIGLYIYQEPVKLSGWIFKIEQKNWQIVCYFQFDIMQVEVWECGFKCFMTMNVIIPMCI